MLHEFWLRLKALVSRRKFDRDLEDEIAFHLAMCEERNRAAAGSDDQARQAARRQFGNATLAREELREMRSFTLLETMWQDVRYGARLLKKSTAFTLVAVLTLSLGIGANTAIFSLTYQILLQRLPVPHPEELVVLRSPGPKEGNTNSDGDNAACFSYPLYKDLRDQDKVFAGLLARFAVPLSVSAMGHAQRAAGELVSGNYFEVLGVNPSLGRLFGPDDETAPGANPVAVLSYGFWTARFGSDSSVLNKQITVNGTSLTIVGVTKPGFTGVQVGQVPDIFIPITMKAQMTPSWNGLEDRKFHWAAIMGRMKPGMTMAASQSAGQTIFHTLLESEVLLEQIPPKVKPRFLARKLLLEPGSHGRPQLQSETKGPLTFLLGMVGLVLLIACANLASLLVAKGEGRQREIAVRLSLGASRGRVLRQLLTEGLLLALAGGLAAIALAPWFLRVVLHLIPEGTMVGLSGGLDAHMLAFALVLSLATTLFFALVPALQLVRRPANASWKERSGGESAAGLRKWLIVAQVVLTTVLLASAGLFTRSLINVKNVNLGLQTEHALEFSISPALSRYSPPQTIDLLNRLRAALAARPGVRSVSAAEVPILAGSTTSAGLTPEGYAIGENEETFAEQNWIAPDYFSTMQIPLLAGREFRDSDKIDSPKVAIVNQSLVRRYFAGRDAIGKHISFKRGNAVPDIEIVGVVADSKHENPREQVTPFAYMPIAQDPHPAGITLYVRTSQQNPSSSADMLRSVVAGLDPALPVYNLETLNEQLNESILADRIVAFLCIWLGSLAAMLAAMGLYGVMAYMVARRTREIGIRMALGATREGVAWMVLREVMRLTFIGLSIGLVTAVATGHLIESQLYGVKGWSPLILICTAAMLLGVALAAGSLPARRAARVQPMIALRYE